MYYITYYNIININTNLYIYYKYISFTIIIYSSMYQPTVNNLKMIDLSPSAPLNTLATSTVNRILFFSFSL